MQDTRLQRDCNPYALFQWYMVYTTYKKRGSRGNYEVQETPAPLHRSLVTCWPFKGRQSSSGDKKRKRFRETLRRFLQLVLGFRILPPPVPPVSVYGYLEVRTQQEVFGGRRKTQSSLNHFKWFALFRISQGNLDIKRSEKFPPADV